MPSRQSTRRRLFRRAPLARRLVAWALVATYAATATGAPLPMWVSSRGTELHPCQGHRCGCSTAEQCWKSCCCYSNKQKLAWAAEHGVTPPEFVVVAAQAEASQAEASRVENSTPSCCRAKRSCCSNSSNCSHAEPPGVSRHDCPIAGASTEKPAIVYVSILESQRCRGTTPTWGSVAISLPPASPVRLPAFDPLVRPFPAISPPAMPPVFFSPAVPPPRVA